jgi:hypothetical protein
MKKIVLLLVLIFSYTIGFSQVQFSKDDAIPTFERFYYGGNLSLGFGNITFVDVSPLVGYMITPSFSAGLGGTYQYLRYNNFNRSTDVYGARAFVRQNLFNNFFAHGEYESLSVDFQVIDPQLGFITQREWVPGVLVGPGLFSPFGRRGGMNITALYNLQYDRIRSPYGSPLVIRAGIIF